MVSGIWILTRRIEGFTEQEKAVFGAALEIEQPSTIMEMANLSCNLDKFAVYPKVQNEAELGEYLLNIQVVDEQLLPMWIGESMAETMHSAMPVPLANPVI
ncbi:MAG: hypothetical protein ACLR0U_25345 [Enterocloster clostridioformis]